MILLRYGERPFSGSPHYAAVGRSIRVDRDGIRLCHELRDRATGAWLERCDALMGITIGHDNPPPPGIYHGWHDGPQCCLWLGRLAIHWSGNPWTGDCRKCREEVGG